MSTTRTPVNPWSWSLDYGFNQAELVEGASRVLVLSGQGPAAADGTLLHAGNFAAQVSLSLDNIETVLKEAGMTLGNVVAIVDAGAGGETVGLVVGGDVAAEGRVVRQCPRQVGHGEDRRDADVRVVVRHAGNGFAGQDDLSEDTAR